MPSFDDERWQELARGYSTSQYTCCLLLLFVIVLAAAPEDSTRPILKSARHHPMQYYLSLPKGWTPQRKWPIVVTIDGGNKAWLKNAEVFSEARGDLPFIIITPIVLTNGGSDLPHMSNYHYSQAVWDDVEKRGRCQFDMNGLQAVIGDVRKQYKGEEKYFITGWSAGGHLLWMMVFMHPETLLAAATSGGNYTGRCITSFSDGSERATLPVRAFQGEMDPYLQGLDHQWAEARRVAEAHGYGNVSHIIVAGKGHEPFPNEVLDYFNSLLKP